MTHVKTFATMPTLPAPIPEAVKVARPVLAPFGAPTPYPGPMVHNQVAYAREGGVSEGHMPVTAKAPAPVQPSEATKLNVPVKAPQITKTINPNASAMQSPDIARDMKLSLHEAAILLSRDIPRVREIVEKRRVYPEGCLAQGVALNAFIKSPELVTLLQTALKTKVKEIGLPQRIPVNPIARTAYVLSGIVDALALRGIQTLNHAIYAVPGESEFATQLRIEDTLEDMLESLAPTDNLYALMPARG